MKIGNFEIGKRTFIIGEVGVNHNGNIETAKELIKVAKDAGCDAVKFQIYITEDWIIEDFPPFAERVAKFHKTQFDRFKSIEFNEQQWRELADYAKEIGIMFLATPFDKKSADLIAELCPAFKISSAEIINFSFVKHIAEKNKPIIASTGMANEKEIEDFLKLVQNNDVALLHCVSTYPNPLENLNLKSIHYIKDKFKVPVGFSDHSEGIEGCIWAVAAGAEIIEKHITLDTKQEIGDHILSADPKMLKEMVEKIRLVEKSLGNYEKKGQEGERTKTLRRSLVAAKDLKEGEIIKQEDLRELMPGTGIPPNKIDFIIGKKLKRSLRKHEIIMDQDLI